MSVHARTPSAQYATTIRLDCPHTPGWIARIASVIGNAGGAIQAIDLVHIERGRSLRDYTVECTSTQHAREIVRAIKQIEEIEVRSASDNTFLQHLLGNIGAAAAMPVMERAAAHAIAATISDEELSPDYVIPSVFNRRVGKQVGRAVARAARESGIARRVHKSSGIPE